MRGHAAGFDEWYEQQQNRLRDDGVSQWFREMRNRIEKRGAPGVVTGSTHVNYVNDEILRRAAPPGAVRTIIGDMWGRNYWVAQLADGTRTNVYFDLDPSIGTNRVSVEDAPDGRDVGDLLRDYLRTLDEVVSDAERTFG